MPSPEQRRACRLAIAASKRARVAYGCPECFLSHGRRFSLGTLTITTCMPARTERRKRLMTFASFVCFNRHVYHCIVRLGYCGSGARVVRRDSHMVARHDSSRARRQAGTACWLSSLVVGTHREGERRPGFEYGRTRIRSTHAVRTRPFGRPGDTSAGIRGRQRGLLLCSCTLFSFLLLSFSA